MCTSLYDASIDKVLEVKTSGAAAPRGKTKGASFPSPADWRDQWIYFLLVDRFNNPSAAPCVPGEPCNTYQGGTFEGIRQRIPYLKELGVGAVWLSPVLMNPFWFKDYWGGYGVQDFTRIEPRFCSDPVAARRDASIADREFRACVDEMHHNGIYVILDIVLNHVGDLFNYEGMRDSAPWNRTREYAAYWRNTEGEAQGTWTDIAAIPDLPPGAGVWPREFQRNDFFRRRGSYDPNGDTSRGDFDRLKELVTEYAYPGTPVFPVRDLLIRAHQYLMAKFDLDGYRIDTLQYIEPEFARVFGNSMREFGLAIGKKNFFTFGEVWQDDDEERIAAFIGRNPGNAGDLVGVDAAVDFPMRKRLVSLAKGFTAPAELAHHFDVRRETLKQVVSSHGEASRYYVTFLDNHDLNERFHCPQYPEQTHLALTLLMTMQGIPCVYYGTEQGLDGHGDRREYVREALWGIPNAFSGTHMLYKTIQRLNELRRNHPALRYGRQYFRPCSGNKLDFGYSPYPGGVLAFSRVLNNTELLVVANTSVSVSTTVHVVVDHFLNPVGRNRSVLYSTHASPTGPGATQTCGCYRTVEVTLSPMEAQVLG